MTTFKELGINCDLLKGIKELGFENPMPIQQKVIPALLKEKTDLIGLAQTGTGKTAAFGLPLIQLTNTDNKSTQVLVLAPTRELCLQIAADLKNYAKYIRGLNIVTVYGGASIDNQIKSIKKGAHIIVATPGRMNDLLNRRKKIDISLLRTVVLDEADEMLSMGFKEELDAILDQTPESKNTLLFSATMPKDVIRISKNYMAKPAEISAGHPNIGAENVKHICYPVHEKNRYLALKRIVDFNPDIYGIVFCRTREETKQVAKKLIHDGYNADALHGDLSQAQRESVMHKFRVKNLHLLTATDVAARGLDVKNLTHIINYKLPDETTYYIHRSGRTGRAGKTGVSIAIINSKEKYKLHQIEAKLKKKFDVKAVPDGKRICEKQLFHFVDRLEKTEVDNELIDRFLPLVSKKLTGLDREELIKHFIALEFSRFAEYYKNAEDLHFPTERERVKAPGSKKSAKTSKHGREQQTEEGFTRFYINLGNKDKLTPSELIGLIIRSTRQKNIDVARIELLKKFSFFEVDEQNTNAVLSGFKNASYNNRKVVVELTKGNGEMEQPSPYRKRRKPTKKRYSKQR